MFIIGLLIGCGVVLVIDIAIMDPMRFRRECASISKIFDKMEKE